MKQYEWNTLHGRFQAARDVQKLYQRGEEKEANELAERLRDASATYDDPEYYIFKDMANKQIIMLYYHRGFDDETLFNQFLRAHLDTYVAHVRSGSTWFQGFVCQQCEPTFTTEKYEKWNVFDTESGLWFEQM